MYRAAIVAFVALVTLPAAAPGSGALAAPPAAFAEAATRWLELLGEAAPGARRVCILLMLDNARDPDVAAWSEIAAAAGQAARRLARRAEVMTVRNRGELLDAFVMMGQSGVDGVVALPTPFALDRAADVAAQAVRHRLPLIGGHRRFADAGALMSYGITALAEARRFELVINAGTARSLGLTIPPSLRLRASSVLE